MRIEGVTQRRTVRWVLTMLLVATSLGPLSQVSAAASPTTLTFLGPKFDEWEAFITVANRLGKDIGIQVKPEYLPWEDVLKKALIDSKSGVKTWDMVYAYNTWVPGIAASKIFTPISDFEKDPELKKQINAPDFIKETTAGLEYQGKLWAYPALAAPYVLAYRTDLLGNADEQKAFNAKYGYALPARPQTYKQLLDVSQFFTRKKGEAVAGKPAEDDFYGICLAAKSGGFLFHRYEMVLVAYGADLIYNQKTMQPTANSKESIAAAKYYTELHKYQQPGSETHTGGGTQRIMAADRCALTMDALDNILSVAEEPKVSKIVGKVGYTLLPTQIASRPHAHVADANGPGIYALSQHKAEAIKLLATVLSTQGTKELMKEYPALVPMRSSVINDPEVKTRYPKMVEAMNSVIKGKPWTVFAPPLKEWVQVQEIVESSLSAALAGQTSPEEAMNAAQAKVVDVFKRARYIK